jgi:hypothetical protein
MVDRYESRSELNEFKREINLVQYAREQGYEIDKQKSCRSSKCLRHPSGDKIIVARDRVDEHWIYFSVRDDRDKGTIVDFVQMREKGADLAEVRRILRRWLGRPEPLVPSPHDLVTPVERDRAVAAAAYLAADQVSNLRYLNERGLRRETLSDPQFAGTWRRDPRHGNALFVHRDRDGISGFEKKNRSFTGFATGGEKTFWYSDPVDNVTRLVVAESAIDALSHYQLRPQSNTRYMSFAGEMSSRQVGLLTQAAAKLPKGGEVVLAVDSDMAADQFVRRLTASLAGLPASVRRDSPELPAKDWNDVLRAKEHEFIRNLPALRLDANYRRARMDALER